MKVDASIFKAYDIRGVVDQALREDAVRAVGRVLGTLAHDADVKRFCVGKDGRLTGERLQNALVEGIASTGMDVLDVGAVPTPVLYYATKHFDCGTGVAVTGSHNPPEYNGLKMMVAGVTLFADQIQGIRERIEQEDWYVAEKPGRIEHVDAVAPYVQKALEGVRLFRQLKVAVDASNGIVGPTMLRILSKLDVEVVPLYCDVDGHFLNHHPDPSKPKNLEALIDEVEEVGADYGFAHDGDRLGVVTNAGEVIYPDRLMMLFTEDNLRTHPGAQIIYDVKCSRKLVDWVRAKDGEPVISPTGHSLVKAKLRETAAPFAGEMSGHLFFNDERLTGFDDGLYSAVRLLEILSRSESPLTVLQRTSQRREYAGNPDPDGRRREQGVHRRVPEGMSFSRCGIRHHDRWGSCRVEGQVCARTRFQYDARAGHTFRRRHEGIARTHPAMLHCRDASRRPGFEDPIMKRRKP